MLTTNCDAVSTKSWVCASWASSACWCLAVTKTADPSAASATTSATSATSATRARWGCLRGGRPVGLDSRTLIGLGASTGPPVDVAAAPLVGPAARDARRRPAGFGDCCVEADSSLIYACLGAIIRSTQFSAGASLSAPPANTPVPPAGSMNVPLLSYEAKLCPDACGGASAGNGGASAGGGESAGGCPGSGNGSPADGGGGRPYGGTAWSGGA